MAKAPRSKWPVSVEDFQLIVDFARKNSITHLSIKDLRVGVAWVGGIITDDEYAKQLAGLIRKKRKTKEKEPEQAQQTK